MNRIINKPNTNRAAAAAIRVLCGVPPLNRRTIPRGPKIFYANHTSHLDFLLIWSVLPYWERIKTRPVAGRDYWIRTRFSRWASSDIFNALLIERQHVTRADNPIEQMTEALKKGYSLIVFPEGTRNTDSTPQEFKSGIHHLALNCPEIPMIPVYLENLNRIMPKGSLLPIPLISRVTFGKPIDFLEGPVSRETCLETLRNALIELIPKHE